MKMVFYCLILLFLFLPKTQAAHYIIGNVNNALDGENANTKEVVLWNPSNGILDNQTDIIGPTGNSGQDNIYMIDCEQLSNPCIVGENLSVQVYNTGDNYISYPINVTVTSAGYDLVENITLNSPIKIEAVEVEDDLSFPINEINLLPATTKEVTCTAILKDYDGKEEILNATAQFFDNTKSGYDFSEDNNEHYKNTSCEINKSYGDSTQAQATCTLNIEYYANPGNWNCTIKATDNNTFNSLNSDLTQINTLLAIGIDSPVNFGGINSNEVSSEKQINITNYGNTKINLSLSGYGQNEGDNLSMSCLSNTNISINYKKYNLTSSTQGTLSLNDFENTYTNLTSNPLVKEFNLNYRQNDLLNEAIKSSYWRIYLPEGVSGTCTGNIVFGATIGVAN